MAGRASAHALGHPRRRSRGRGERPASRTIDDFNTGDNEGSSYFQVNQKRGRRWSAARGFLKPALNAAQPAARDRRAWSSACCSTDGRADRRRRSGRGGEAMLARAAGEVVLAAGAVGSPQLLELSGIGDGARLAGARASASSTTCPASARTCRTTCSSGRSTRSGRAHAQQRLRQAPGAAPAMGARIRSSAARGPLTMAPSQLGVFARSVAGLRDAPTSSSTSSRCPSTSSASRCTRSPPSPPASATCGPRAAAAIHAARARPGRRARDPRRTTSRREEDRRVAVDALRLTRRIVAQAPLATLPAAGIPARRAA